MADTAAVLEREIGHGAQATVWLGRVRLASGEHPVRSARVLLLQKITRTHLYGHTFGFPPLWYGRWL